MASPLELTVIGNIGNIKDLQYTQSGREVLNFTAAHNASYTNQAGEKMETTTWVACVIWGPLAATMAGLLTTGRQVYVRGTPSAKAWTNKNGEAQATLELNVRDIQLLGPRPGGAGAGAGDEFPNDTGDMNDIPF